MRSMTNIFLIRDPHQLIASFAQVIPNPTMRDIGVRQQAEMHRQLQDWGSRVIVVDSGDLLKDPPRYLQALCQQLDIEYVPSMVSWPAGAIDADGVWAKHWYANVHASTGLTPQPTSTRPLPENCQGLFEESLPYYEELSKYALRI